MSELIFGSEPNDNSVRTFLWGTRKEHPIIEMLFKERKETPIVLAGIHREWDDERIAIVFAFVWAHCVFDGTNGWCYMTPDELAEEMESYFCDGEEMGAHDYLGDLQYSRWLGYGCTIDEPEELFYYIPEKTKRLIRSAQDFVNPTYRWQEDPQVSPVSRDVRYKKQTIPEDIRWKVWERDNFTCKACGSRKSLSVDHIFPEVMGGTLDLDNLQTLCKKCNCKKGARV